MAALFGGIRRWVYNIQMSTETWELLSYVETALDNPDLKLFSHDPTPDLTDEQHERMLIIFSMAVSLFERAYLILYDEDLSDDQQRRWRSWDDYMREWCQREDFREHLPDLLVGEDPNFVTYIMGLAEATR